MKRFITVTLLSVGCIASAAAQPLKGLRSSAETLELQSAADASSVDAPPAFVLDFRVKPAIPRLEASPLIALPILCSPTGIPFITVPEPPTYTDQSIYSLDPKEPRRYSYKDIQGIYDIHLLSFFPGETAVLVLVNATKDPKQTEYETQSQNGKVLNRGRGFRGERHEFILRFDLSGAYHGATMLHDSLSFHRIAELADGNLVAVAFDRANSVPRLELLDSDGSVIRQLSIPSELESNPQLHKGNADAVVERAIAETQLSRWLFAPARKTVLLYQSRSKAPVLEIGQGGAVREVHIDSPACYYLGGVISSSNRWIFRYIRNTPSGQTAAGPEVGDNVLYDVDPHDGHLKSQLKPSNGPTFGIACEHDGIVTGFSLGPDSKYIPYTADAPK